MALKGKWRQGSFHICSCSLAGYPQVDAGSSSHASYNPYQSTTTSTMNGMYGGGYGAGGGYGMGGYGVGGGLRELGRLLAMCTCGRRADLLVAAPR